MRAAWAVLPFTAGPALAAALDSRARPVQVAASTGLWGLWAVVLVATLVPHPVSLTALRLVAPAVPVGVVGATVAGHGSPVAVASAVVVVALAFAPELGAWFVNGPAYPNERRFLLRVPAPLLVGMVPLAWIVGLGAPTAGVLLLATRRWVAGAVVLGLGAPLAAVFLRALHGLSRRWLVFVPAGVVLHDTLTLIDPVLFRRQVIEAFGPAPAGSTALDLTQGTPGLALELRLKEEVPLMLMRPGRRSGENRSVSRLLVTPTRPGAVLREAAARRIPAG